ncbi:MAG: PAS domain-containing protein [Methyloversatilis sp.]|nr:PAS domain-containing protein [Methyloversatilis sp.]
MNPVSRLGRHFALHWLAWLLSAIGLALLTADFSGLLGEVLHERVSRSGIALQLVPVLLLGVVLCAVGIALDRARLELERAQAELERAQLLGRTGTWAHADGRFLWSPRALAILGLPAEAAVDFEALLARVVPEDRARLERAWRTANAGARHRAEFSVNDGEGGQRRLLFEGRLEQIGDSGPRLAGIVQDTSEQFRMEGALRRASRYQRALLDNFPFMVWLKDRNLRFLAVNRPLAQAGGLSDPDEACGLGDEDLWPSAEAAAYRAEDMDVLASRSPLYSEKRVGDGEQAQWYESWTAPVLDDNGELLGTVGYARDIGGRKRAEAALARSRDRFAEVGRLQARFIAGEPEDSLYASLLDLACELSGCADGFLAEVAHDAAGVAQISLLACRDIDWLGERADLIDIALRADGAPCAPGQVIAAAGDGPDGRGLLCLAVTRGTRLTGLIGLGVPDGRLGEIALADLQVAVSSFGLILEAGLRERARQRTEADLVRHRDRLAQMVELQMSDTLTAKQSAERAHSARSEFLARVSHELRTPIHAILGFSRLALRDADRMPDGTRHRLDAIRQNGERLLARVDDLLDLSQLQSGALTLNRTCCDIAEIVSDVVSDLRGAAVERRLALRLEGAGHAVPGDADRVRLMQVLTRMLSHALRATPEGGEVVVTVVADHSDGCHGARVSIADQGGALGEGGLERLFDPFEQVGSSRGHGPDVGLGLAVCREIMTLHQGWIRAAEVGLPDGRVIGTRLDLWLPAPVDVAVPA